MSTEPSPNQENPVNEAVSPQIGVPAAGQGQPSPRKGNRSGFNNGGHRPKGIHTPLKTKKVYDVEELATKAADAFIAGNGRGLRTSPLLGPASDVDRNHIQRITGESVEVFNEHMASRLRVIAEKASQRIEQKLDNDEFKSGELGFILSVAHDKRLSLDGSRALHNAAINVTVNQFGPSPKSALLSELDGLGHTKNVTPVESQPVG